MAHHCPLNLPGIVRNIGEIGVNLRKDQKHNFSKSFQFSPDGYSAISAYENCEVAIYSIDDQYVCDNAYYNGVIGNKDGCETFGTKEGKVIAIQSTVPVGESVYDLKWYPMMIATDPATKCFATTSRDHPITLWDATASPPQSNFNETTSRVRCTYRGYNHVDELDSSISLCFNLTGDRIYAGSNRMIR